MASQSRFCQLGLSPVRYPTSDMCHSLGKHQRKPQKCSWPRHKSTTTMAWSKRPLHDVGRCIPVPISPWTSEPCPVEWYNYTVVLTLITGMCIFRPKGRVNFYGRLPDLIVLLRRWQIGISVCFSRLLRLINIPRCLCVIVHAPCDQFVHTCLEW